MAPTLKVRARSKASRRADFCRAEGGAGKYWLMGAYLVTGGTGVLGRVVAERLRERGREVRGLSRRAGAGTHVGDPETGVAEAVAGVAEIVHAASGNNSCSGGSFSRTRLIRIAPYRAVSLWVTVPRRNRDHIGGRTVPGVTTGSS
ncbi:NAD-dependent epimerase/dehydratase family protein [Nocardia acidivorans]|uniref:NAD-dependent epimerase/dehydratase family protein n=1 Tax=Nocardia acidivorans TaxID=404580 RepID=UPI0027D92778|nr:NAD-dependent epimerase/dehydratase family protein [Nocardia acidivorans]